MLVPSDFQLTYRPDLAVLVARWYTDSTFPALQSQYAALLSAAHQHGTSRVLLDIRRRNATDEESSRWFTYEWLPQAAAAVSPRRLRLAFFIAPTRAAALRTDAAMRPHLTYAMSQPTSHDLNVFEDEGEATRWLLA